MQPDTIYAPSTAVGGAIAVIRVSGPDARKAARLFDRDVTREPQKLLFARAVDDGEIIDDCMAVYFPAPRTYTGEDQFEIHCHGGMQTVQRLLGMLASMGFRPADGGEFTKRAFLNGKLDLSQAEAVMDVITASAEQSRKAAMLQLHGSVSREIDAVERLLLDALSGIDAALDYPDEAEDDAIAALPASLTHAIARLNALLTEGRRGRVLRDGLRLAFLGRPNVGKSSLLNALLGEERAIVTASAGTTRDVLEERTSFSGVPVRLIDTAGLRESDNEAERIGVDRARAVMQSCDVLCLVLDGSMPLTDADCALLRETGGALRVVLINKSDLPRPASSDASLPLPPPDALRVSAVTGSGLDAFRARILALAAPERQDANCITNERHLRLLERALDALDEACRTPELDCAATDIRSALHFLGGVTGTDVDARVIERIFERFCVGK